jgi:putative flippase GtrA
MIKTMIAVFIGTFLALALMYFINDRIQFNREEERRDTERALQHSFQKWGPSQKAVSNR